MAQLSAEILSKFSAPHLRSLKKKELLDLYTALHVSYVELGPDTVPLDNDEEEPAQKAVQSPTQTMTVRETPVMMRETTMPMIPTQPTKKRIVRDESGRILEVIEEPIT